MSIFYGMHAASAAARANATAGEASRTARTTQTTVAELEQRLDRAMMACEAMWVMMRDKMGITDVELIDKINEIDLSDGQLDGKVRKTAVSCPKCRRTISRRHPRCMYCGQTIVHDPFA